MVLWKSWKIRRGKRVERRSRRLASISHALELYGEAAGIAQEGQPEEARGILQRYLQEPRKILVFTGPEGGSREFRRYVVSLAKRMDCEIWHVRPSSSPVGGEEDPFVDTDEEVRYHKLELQGEMESLVHELLGRLKRVELILTEERELPEVDVPIAVYVFTPRMST